MLLFKAFRCEVGPESLHKRATLFLNIAMSFSSVWVILTSYTSIIFFESIHRAFFKYSVLFTNAKTDKSYVFVKIIYILGICFLFIHSENICWRPTVCVPVPFYVLHAKDRAERRHTFPGLFFGALNLLFDFKITCVKS